MYYFSEMYMRAITYGAHAQADHCRVLRATVILLYKAKATPQQLIFH